MEQRMLYLTLLKDAQTTKSWGNFAILQRFR